MGTMFPNNGGAGLTRQRRKQKSSVPGQQRDSLPDTGNPTNRIMRSLADEIIVGQQLRAHRCPGATQPFPSSS